MANINPYFNQQISLDPDSRIIRLRVLRVPKDKIFKYQLPPEIMDDFYIFSKDSFREISEAVAEPSLDDQLEILHGHFSWLYCFFQDLKCRFTLYGPQYKLKELWYDIDCASTKFQRGGHYAFAVVGNLIQFTQNGTIRPFDLFTSVENLLRISAQLYLDTEAEAEFNNY